MALKLAASTEHKKPTYAYVNKIEGAEAAMNTLREEMYNHDIDSMAETIEVSTACLYAIRGGRTKWPRPKTFFGLIGYMHLSMYLVKGRINKADLRAVEDAQKT